MGICSGVPEGDLAKQKRSKQIQNQNIESYTDHANTKKLLFLGPGESGKSTMLKQMVHLYGEGYSTRDRKTYTRVIYSNIVSSMKVLVRFTKNIPDSRLGGGGGREHIITEEEHAQFQLYPENECSADFFVHINEDSLLTNEVAMHVERLWNDPGIQNAYRSAHSRLHIPVSMKYFFNNIHAYTQEGFVPTMKDVLSCRMRTTGIVETDFNIGNSPFTVVDVGGQRNERRKWIHCFEGVTAVIFVTAISEYDQMLYEDESTNRMDESLNLFDEICNSRWFRNTSMILFLNKSDLLKSKIHETPINVFFEDYMGNPNDFDASCHHIRGSFESRNRTKSRVVYTHITCAMDEDNVRHVISAVKDTVVHNSLREGGLL